MPRTWVMAHLFSESLLRIRVSQLLFPPPTSIPQTYSSGSSFPSATPSLPISHPFKLSNLTPTAGPRSATDLTPHQQARRTLSYPNLLPRPPPILPLSLIIPSHPSPTHSHRQIATHRPYQQSIKHTHKPSSANAERSAPCRSFAEGAQSTLVLLTCMLVCMHASKIARRECASLWPRRKMVARERI